MLSDAMVRAAKPGDKAVKLFDGKGLYLTNLPTSSRTRLPTR
jgi:hypothetical protein